MRCTVKKSTTSFAPGGPFGLPFVIGLDGKGFSCGYEEEKHEEKKRREEKRGRWLIKRSRGSIELSHVHVYHLPK